jgi:hypothetical protein
MKAPYSCYNQGHIFVEDPFDLPSSGRLYGVPSPLIDVSIKQGWCGVCEEPMTYDPQNPPVITVP